MQPRFNALWLIILVPSALFSMLYLWQAVFPGKIAPDVFNYFTSQQVDAAREYARVARLLFIGSFLVQATLLLWLVFGGPAVAIYGWAQEVSGGSYRGGILLVFFVAWLAQRAVSLPFQLFGDYFWQHRWGFLTQTLSSWWLDYFKMAGLDLLLSFLGVLMFFWIINRWHGSWWLIGASFFSLWLIVQSYLWPVAVAPLFNRFEPARDPVLVADVRNLSGKAGLPVDEVLVMDASQRTTRANAYFAGLGKTKQIVLYDTLLRDYPRDEVEAVVAHEMAHWRQGHILKGLAMGILGSFLLWGILFLVLRTTLDVRWYMHYPAHTWIVVLLFFLLASFASSPLQNYFSRRMETEADRVSITLTENPGAALRLQLDLAKKNLSDPSPPSFIRWFSYSHPAVLERINTIIGDIAS